MCLKNEGRKEKGKLAVIGYLHYTGHESTRNSLFVKLICKWDCGIRVLVLINILLILFLGYR